MATINKIKVGNTEYDIEASAIGDISSLRIETSQNTQTPEILIKSNSTGEKTSGNDADIRFEVASNKSVATSGIVAGVVGLNTKGNLSVESLNKHVNIESAKGIQLKPTTNIIFDTSRRITAPGHTEDKDNEAVIEVKYDDKEVSAGQEYTQFGYLKFNSRAVDITCFWHGGIALQPAGIDGSGHENKIKFESSRKVSANSVIPSTLRRGDQNYTQYYTIEGGKGVEFGTFNNEHASIFTKDYRFNNDGLVYSVVRGTPVTSGDKTDYPTQPDDFKDIPVDNDGFQGTYNLETGKWELSANAGKYLLAASWGSIVKTAHALNDQPWTDTNISGKGNLQITTVDEVEWVASEDDGNAIVLASDKQDPKRKYVGDGHVYKLIDNNFYVARIKTNGEHHLNLESDSTIKLESAYNDIELTAGDKVQVSAPSIQFEASGNVDFSTTPEVSFMARKINKYGGYESSDALLKITSLNNLNKTVYENTGNQTVRIPFDTLYTATGTFEPYLISLSKVAVFSDPEHTTMATPGNYMFKLGALNVYYEVSLNKAGTAAETGKKAKVCSYDDVTLYTAANTPFVLDTTTDYSSSTPTLYTNSEATTTASGYYVAKDSENTEYIIYTNSSGVMTQFLIDNNSASDLGWFLLYSSRKSNYDYTGIIFGGNDEAGSGETAVASGAPLNVGNLECNINDIVILVNFFKTGAGKQNGPWAS